METWMFVLKQNVALNSNARTESSGDRMKNCNENKKRDTEKKGVIENGE